MPEARTVSQLVLSVPVEVPSPAEMTAIIRQAAMDVAAKQLAWMSFKQAAAHMGVPMRTFQRKKKALNIPVCELDGVKRIARQDLDAILLAHIPRQPAPVIQFPTLILKAAAWRAA